MIYDIKFTATKDDGTVYTTVLQVKGTKAEAMQIAAVGVQERGWRDIEIAKGVADDAAKPVIEKARAPRKKYESSPEARARKRKYNDKYDKEARRFIGLYLHREIDADILAELERAESIQARAKELMRKGLNAERREK